MSRILTWMTNAFAVWTILGTAWAWFVPSHFTWFRPYIGPGLGVIMLGMGITLTFADFKAVLKIPLAIGVGVAAQYIAMPLLAFGFSKAFQLETGLAVGLILTGCCPGGTASNVITYLSRANLPLSVLLTMCSTLVAIVMTPLLTGLLAGQFVDVDRWGLFKSVLYVVFLPVVGGIVLNQFVPKLGKAVKPVAPLVSVIVIVLIVGCIVGASKDLIRANAGILITAVFLMHCCGFGLGYLFAVLLGYSEDYRRTLAIEVGMQNSGLGARLAQKHFVIDHPSAPVPPAISAVCHCLIGSLLAAVWRINPPKNPGKDPIGKSLTSD